ncbi:MAG: hypothetical protein WCO84_08915, partial [bacterium]
MKTGDMIQGLIGSILVAGVIVAVSHILNEGLYNGKIPKFMWSVSVGLSLLIFTIPVFLLGKMKLVDMLAGALGVVVVSKAISMVGIILDEGLYSGQIPNIMWSLTVGLAIIIFSIPVLMLGKMKLGDMLQGALGVVVVSVALAITSHIINESLYGKYPVIQWALGVGIAIIAFSISLWILSKVNSKDLEKGAIGAVVVSIALMMASWIVGAGDYKNYPSFSWAVGVGIGLILIGTAALILGKMNFNNLLTGSIGVVVVSLAVMLSSWIISAGKYDGKYPSIEWAKGVGLSLIGFTIPIIALGLIAMTGAGIGAIFLGAAFTLLVAGVIVATSYILGLGKYDNNYPSVDWAMGVGLALITITGALVILGIPIVAILVVIGAVVSLVVAAAIVAVSEILNKGNFSGGPSKDWAQGVGMLILSFTTALVILGVAGPLALIGSLFIKKIARVIVTVAEILNEGNYSGGPTLSWINGVKESLSTFIKVAQSLDSSAMNSLEYILNVTQIVVAVSLLLKSGDYTVFPPLEWINNVGLSLTTFTILLIDIGAIIVKRKEEFLTGLYYTIPIAQTLVVVSLILKM